jgi:hypothetical protein
MQYNFELRAQLPDEDLKEIISAGPEGLEASSNLIVAVQLKLNTELQDDAHIEALREAVSGVLSDKLGVEAEAIFLSQEH